MLDHLRDVLHTAYGLRVHCTPVVGGVRYDSAHVLHNIDVLAITYGAPLPPLPVAIAAVKLADYASMESVSEWSSSI